MKQNQRQLISVPKKVQNKRKQNKRKPNQQKLRMQLSSCARNYLHALVNPFVQINGSELPCIPDHIVLPSNKLQVTARGTMTLGTAGFGFIICDPFVGINSTVTTAGTSTNWPVLYTGPTYTLPSINIAVSGGTFATGVFGAPTNSPYSDASVPLSRADFRLVGCGLRMRYSGNEFNRGGTIAIARSQDNSSFPNGGTVANFLVTPLSAQAPVTRSWKSVVYAPSSISDVSYQPFSNFSQPAGGVPHYALAFAVQGPAFNTSQQTFDFEYVAYYELIGNNLQLSPSHSDPVGVGAIQAVTSTARLSEKPPEQQEASALSRLGQYLANGMSGLAKAAGNAALSYATKTVMNAGVQMLETAPPLLLTL